MKRLLKHKGYFGEVYYSEEDECYVGRVLGIRSMLAVHEDTASETIKELIDSIDDYLQFCEDEGRMPNSTDPAVARELESYFENDPRNDMRVIQANHKLALAH